MTNTVERAVMQLVDAAEDVAKLDEQAFEDMPELSMQRIYVLRGALARLYKVIAQEVL